LFLGGYPMSRNSGIFSTETFRFFRELGRNNHKPWMDANRERYRAHVVAPFRALLDCLTPAARKLNPGFDVSGRTGQNFSRINRDIRFAADKSPYRAQMYLKFSQQGSEDGGDGQLYVGVTADAVTVGFRTYYESRESSLARLGIPRARDNGTWIARQQRRLGKKYESYWYSSEKGKWTKHKGWPKKPEEWKRLKGWIVRKRFRPGAATRADFPREVSRIFGEVFPLYRFTSSPSWKR
jgi:uncharacterized protein (TIGR02453 family)